MDSVNAETSDLFQCPKCGKKLKDNRCLQVHLKRKLPCDRDKTLRCEKCGKVFEHKGHYDRHINDRKTPCEPIVGGVAPSVENNENKCVFCNRNFTSKKRLENHAKTCKVANNRKVYAGGEFKPGLEVLTQIVSQTDNSREITMKELAKYLVDEMESRRSDQRVVNVTQNITQNFTQNNLIIINNFEGKQNLDKINMQDVIKTLKMEMHEIIPTLTEKIHHDVEENRNIYLPNLKDDKVLVLKTEGTKKVWNAMQLREAFIILMRHGVDLLYKADDDLSAIGKLLTDEEGDRFEMLINKQRSNSIYDEDIEAIKPVLYKMHVLHPLLLKSKT